MQPFIQRNRVLLLHLSFWLVYLSFNLYQVSVFQRDRGWEWAGLLISLGLQLFFIVITAYFNYFITLPRFLKSKNVWRYALEFSVPFAILVAIRVYLQRSLVDGFSHRVEFFYTNLFIVQIIAVTLLITFFVAMLRFAVEWFELEAKKREVENEKLTAELNFLKAQINPHFLFNTLNNLYYLAYTKSSNTTEVVAKLSQMMRYMIYDSNHQKVLLSKEIEYMQNYIDLERLRLNDQIPVNFKVEGNPESVMIAPLIFITFLENAFKHGVSNTADNSWVNVNIHINGRTCTYEVDNSKVKVKKDGHEKSGIGLQNVKRRLELSYPGQYTLAVSDQPDSYSVQLKLSLS